MKKLHIVPHSHWDREWYMPFEKHRYKLVKLFDALITLMETNPRYKYYHMDGQTIAVEDYLRIRPHMRKRLIKLIQDDRIQIGPWYILQDEYLISGEANIRNMQVGMKLCREFGADPVMVGYFPDSFGNISQAPQIVAGFGIKTAIFGRGILRMGANNEIRGRKELVSSEITWRSPDGSEVLGIMMANWYNNAWELPTEETAAAENINRIFDLADKYSISNNLLGMSGCDHQPVQLDLTEAIDVAVKGTNGRFEVAHSSIRDFLDAVLAENLDTPVLEGEIAGQLTDGFDLLINTASSRIYQKRKNHDIQKLLETKTEPVAAMAYALGAEYETDFLDYAWKRLLENHAHDSICGCSVDEVHQEMMTRYAKSAHVAESVRDTAAEFLSNSIGAKLELGYPIVVTQGDINPKTGLVRVNVDLDSDCKIDSLAIFRENGEALPSTCQRIENVFTYTLPDDSFRKVKYLTRFALEFLIDTAGTGYETVYAREGECALPLVLAGDNFAENDDVKFEINKNGSLNVTDKVNGLSSSGWLIFEDTVDVGDEYNYHTIPNATTTSQNATPEIKLVENTAIKAVFKIKHKLHLSREVIDKVPSKEKVDNTVVAEVSLYSGAKQIDFKVKIDNQSKNHRLRALFPTMKKTEFVYAQGQFDVVKRSIAPWAGWRNDCNAQRMENFMFIEDDTCGVMAATRGLHEYEILRDGKNTLALTLLRSVGELGDWGVFLTPEAQCMGENVAEFAIELYSPEMRMDAAQRALGFSNGELFAFQAKGTGELSSHRRFCFCDNSSLAFSAFMKAEKSAELLLRVYNLSDDEQMGVVTLDENVKSVRRVRLDEETVENLAINDNKISVNSRPHEIVTLCLGY